MNKSVKLTDDQRLMLWYKKFFEYDEFVYAITGTQRLMELIRFKSSKNKRIIPLSIS